MQINDLIIDTLRISNTVSTQYKQEDIIRSLNHYQNEIVLEIWKGDSNWRFDESLDDLPVAIANLEKDITNYLLPSDARKVQRIEVEYGGLRYPLKPIAKEEIRSTISKSGKPTHYYLEGRTLFLYPYSDKDVEEGLFLYVSKSVTPLDIIENTTPRFDSEFHRFLSIGAAYDWYFAKGNITKSRELERRLNLMRQEIKTYYSDRNSNYKSRIRVKRQRYE